MTLNTLCTFGYGTCDYTSYVFGSSRSLQRLKA